MASAKKEDSLRWIKDEMFINTTAGYGQNLKSVKDNLSDQKQRQHIVTSYGKQVSALPENDKKDVEEKYGVLKYVADKRTGCLDNVSKIAELETSLGALSIELSTTASSLVSSHKEGEVPANAADGVPAASQRCIQGVKDNWQWLKELMSCAEIHLQNSSDYHQFFHEITEYTAWMPVELKAAQDKVKLHEQVEGSNQEGQRWLFDLKELLTLFLHWQNKVEKVFARSKKIVPVHLRTEKLQYFRPVESMANYETNRIVVKKGEELLLTDNSDPESWQVRNVTHNETHVPSIICLIPGPHPEAIQAAMSLRLQLLTEWTLNVKRVGKSIILFTILVLRDFSDDEMKKLKAMSGPSKTAVLESLKYIEETLAPYWKGYKGFDELQSRIQNFRKIIAEQEQPKFRDEQFEKQLVDKVQTVEDLLKNYRTMWSQWEAYKILVESSRQADNLLIVDKWEQLKFISMEELRKLWQQGLAFGDGDNMDFDEWMKMIRTAWNKKTQYELETTIERTKETHTTDQVSTAEHEEERKFVITGVVDPASGYEVSMQDAIKKGIINNNEGTYVNPRTGFAIPIPQAMNEGKIKGELQLVKKSEEKKTDMGLITIRTQRESRPYTIQSVKDAKTDKLMSIDEAINNKILDEKKNIYHNSLTNKPMSLADALESGLLVVKFDETSTPSEPEVVTITYAIYWVKDRLRNEKVSFSKAMQDGLLNIETGQYFNNTDGEFVKITDAIKSGDIRATVVKDPAHMKIDPKNIVVVEALDNAKQRFLGGLKTLASMRKAGESLTKEYAAKSSSSTVATSSSKTSTTTVTSKDEFSTEVMPETKKSSANSDFSTEVMPETKQPSANNEFSTEVMPETSEFSTEVMPETKKTSGNNEFSTEVMPETSEFSTEVMPETKNISANGEFSPKVMPEASKPSAHNEFSTEVIPETKPTSANDEFSTEVMPETKKPSANNEFSTEVMPETKKTSANGEFSTEVMPKTKKSSANGEFSTEVMPETDKPSPYKEFSTGVMPVTGKFSTEVMPETEQLSASLKSEFVSEVITKSEASSTKAAKEVNTARQEDLIVKAEAVPTGKASSEFSAEVITKTEEPQLGGGELKKKQADKEKAIKEQKSGKAPLASSTDL